jgi:hypothetical protein
MNANFFYIDAIKELSPGIRFSARIDEFGVLDYHNIKVDDGTGTIPSMEQIQNKAEELYQAALKKTYASHRTREYPSIGDQLDSLFKAGVFPEDMAAKIQAVKDKYPKT